MAKAPTGSPRSVPDPAGEAYDRQFGRRGSGGLTDQIEQGLRKHPGLGESLIPVWGSAREAVADAYEGDYAGAAINGALAVSDLVPGTAAVKAGARTVTRLAARKAGGLPYSQTWNATRKRLKGSGYLPAGVDGHHWLIPQNGWGKSVPDVIKNDPANILPLPPATHQRLHRKWAGEPRFNPLERFVVGTPTEVKVVAGQAVARPVMATKAQLDKRQAPPPPRPAATAPRRS